MNILDWLIGFSEFVAGLVVGTIITGVFTWKVVIPRIMKQRDVAKLVELLKSIVDRADKIAEKLDEILEASQNKN